MLWLKLLSNFLRIMREGQTPAQIAGGFALGAIVGFSPMLTLQGVVVWFIILILNVNLSAAVLGFTVCSIIAYIFDPLFHYIGYFVLVEIDALRSLWTTLYNAPLAPLTRFNNTVVMGSFLCAILLSVPIYFGMREFVILYRKTLAATVDKWRIVQIMKTSTLYKWYIRIRDLGGVL
ncbi:MAG: TIGR03546 family protein [Bacteroidetes bacterium]|nr:TIGR03546 family protein [Bacteroidota bacterium]